MSTRQGDRTRRLNRRQADQVIRDRYARGYAHWPEYRIEGKLPLVRGRRLRVTGERGWFVFVDAGRDSGGEFLNCCGPFSKNSTEIHGNARAFAPDRVIKVERQLQPATSEVETMGERAERLGLNRGESS